MLDAHGFVSETNATNLFVVKGDTVLTPHADACLPGITRQTVIRPKYINKAKQAIKQAFIHQMENRCYSMVEVVSTCPTNWGMTPLDSIGWVEEQLLPYYPLGDLKTPESAEEVA